MINEIQFLNVYVVKDDYEKIKADHFKDSLILDEECPPDLVRRADFIVSFQADG